TNRDLLQEAQNNTFRLDLYYRLVVAPIFIPPLRDRPQDVRGLGAPMLEAAARRMGRVLPRITDAAWTALENHTWPGNVRELSNVMERLVIYHAGKEVDVPDLNLPVHVERVSEPPPPSTSFAGGGFASSQRVMAAVGNNPSSGNVRITGLNSPRQFPAAPATDPQTITLRVPETGTTFDDLEREILVQVLQRAEGNQSRAARSLGLSESTLRSRLKRLGLKG
ncbi:MAG TPA: helix-turn-helix domain-containing protein, partial [Polyangiaceae bacterium]